MPISHWQSRQHADCPARKLNDNNYRVALYCARTAVSGANGHFEMDKRVTYGNDTYIEIFGTNPVYN